MPSESEIQKWREVIRTRYENYLKISFYFKDADLRRSFQSALQEEGSLLKGPFPESARGFSKGKNARDLARSCFPENSEELLPAFIDKQLYVHQERAVRATHMDRQNIVVATGTASGKTESFLYPILFELYRQHLAGELQQEPGVRALILYPMNALANDQRQRLGEICEKLAKAGSKFQPTFGQYIGQTLENRRYHRRNARMREEEEERLPGELIFRQEMRTKPPHILLTNYSMLEYLLIRPNDSPLFDNGRHWQFIVLDEAHQYRGVKGMEMGMLIRRLKQRLRAGGRGDKGFRCIATSATISSDKSEKSKIAVAQFAGELFGEKDGFSTENIVFGERKESEKQQPPSRFHLFMRVLEGAFLIHQDGADAVVLNRKGVNDDDATSEPLEIALCRECGQHYYVGQERNGKLQEAVRDPSQRDFGVDYYLPSADGATHVLCRRCGEISKSELPCDCEAPVRVKKCEPHKEHADQLKQCATCGYQRGGIGDPVQEIVHGSDGPNAVIATALHELLPEDRRKVLAFADSRQEAAFFAWYAQDSYEKLRNRNLMLRAMKAGPIDPEGLSIDDLKNRLFKQWEEGGLFVLYNVDTREGKNREVLKSILREALTDERRLSLSGVGLVRWSVKIPDDVELPSAMEQPPWNLTEDEGLRLLEYLIDELRMHLAMNLPEGSEVPGWSDVSTRNQQAYGLGPPGKRRNVREWGGPQSTIVRHFLRRLLADSGLPDDQKRSKSIHLMEDVWSSLRSRDGRHGKTEDHILTRAQANGTFRLNPRWLRIHLAKPDEIWECDTCARLTPHNVRNVCPRNKCPGNLKLADQSRLRENHYRILYESEDLPPTLSAEEHTAQIESDKARERQDRFKDGKTHLLSSSTTFEVGVDLGDLEVVFLRNVPPEPFNYTQRVGRTGRRETGLAVTYCRRNPHDLYHFENPKERVIEGKVRPPRLQMTNTKIVIRHMVAAALSVFFKQNEPRFRSVQEFVGDWAIPCAVSDLKRFCKGNTKLRNALCQIVPENMHQEIGLTSDAWVGNVTGPESRFANVEAEVCRDYRTMKMAEETLIKERPFRWTSKVKQMEDRMKTIASEKTLNFLSRKAVIPKYGFPVDVVELDTHPKDGPERGVSLQRDLSQAIAEYAPGGKVVANKLEWQSCGIKVIHGKAWPVRHYQYDGTWNFRQWKEGDPKSPSGSAKYLSPTFGFVTPLFEQPKEPRGRAQRLYTTRPLFQGFENETLPKKTILGVQVTKAMPGEIVALCEGKNRHGFYICQECGAGFAGKKNSHESPNGSDCTGTLKKFSLGHEFSTDVTRLDFPYLRDKSEAYSLAYAVLLGAASALEVPDADLNVTITSRSSGGLSIVLYDNVPGGAGLVANLYEEDEFRAVLKAAKERVKGECGCDSSCYGCLRSYRNQFAHPHLQRGFAFRRLEEALEGRD